MPNSNQRVPPQCWTADETRALVVAYRDRWFSVNRGSLRSPDWAVIAESVPPKTPLQCQHKVEKLRRRYREEKRRLLQNPARSSSSWDLFPLLDSMEIGYFGSSPGPEPESEPAPVGLGASVGGRFGLDSRARCGKNVDVDFDEIDRRGGFAGDEAVGPVEELARAIMISAESFVKVEEMKMEVAAEVERMRMETELRRNEMVLDLQVKVMEMIADSLAGSCDAGRRRKKKKRKGVEVVSTDCTMNCVPHCVDIDSEGIDKAG